MYRPTDFRQSSMPVVLRSQRQYINAREPLPKSLIMSKRRFQRTASSCVQNRSMPKSSRESSYVHCIFSDSQDFPAVLTAFIHSSSPMLCNPAFTISQTSFGLVAPKSLPSIAVRYATPARTRTASPSKTITSQRRVAWSRFKHPVKRLEKISRRYASGCGAI